MTGGRRVEKAIIRNKAVIFSTWLDLPGVITPADIAHGFIEIRKPPHHDKVQSSDGLPIHVCV
jgi:hypothetical protein